jgi:hypothetical protein
MCEFDVKPRPRGHPPPYGKVSPLFYVLGIGLAFVNPWLSVASYVTVALIWLIPDRRVERTLAAAPPET